MSSPPIRSGNAFIDSLFDLCVSILKFLADLFGVSYNTINIWIFCILWPLFTIFLAFNVTHVAVDPCPGYIHQAPAHDAFQVPRSRGIPRGRSRRRFRAVRVPSRIGPHGYEKRKLRVGGLVNGTAEFRVNAGLGMFFTPHAPPAPA